MSLWGNPQGGQGGDGEGGGTPSVVRWSDIRDKPEEFVPKEHSHVIAEVEGLSEVIQRIDKEIDANAGAISVLVVESENIEELLQNKVNKEEGKGLSTNDLTDEILDVIRDLQEEQSIESVISVNGKTGEVTLSKEDFGLSNVLNIRQASEEDFLIFQAQVERELQQKVNVVEGKGLSTNDFTNEDKQKLDDLSQQQTEGDVTSVNGKKGIVVLNKEDIGLENVLNKTQATAEEFQLLAEEVSDKVNKEENKDLVENDLIQILQDFQTKGYVFTINGENGIVELDNVSIGLGEVDNIKQASKLEHEALEMRVNNHELALENKVDKQLGKDLSTNDFTNAHLAKLEAITVNPEIPDNIVETINGKTGVVELTKNDIGLSNITNEKQATEQQLHSEIARIEDSLGLYVLKEDGKELSSNDFTDKEKQKLEDLTVNELPENIVETINGKTGVVELDKADLELGNVLNVTQASIVQHQALERQVTNLANQVSNKVDSETGKGLSTNDYTNHDKQKLESFPELNELVTSVNNQTGEVFITKEDIQLSLVDNVQQASKTEFNAHVNQEGLHVTEEMKNTLLEIPELKSELETKVNIREGFDLSTNDFTDDYKQTIETLPPQVQGLGTAINGHIEDEDIHMNTKDRLALTEALALSEDVAENTQLLGKVQQDFQTHNNNQIIHLTESDREELEKISDFNRRININTSSIASLQEEFLEHIEDSNYHLNAGDRESLNSLPKLSEDVDDLSERETFLTQQVNSIGNSINETNEKLSVTNTQVQANEASIKHILEILEEDPSAVLPDGYIEELAQGHLYAFGNEVFDIINRNVIQGTMARRFALDNKDGLLSKDNFQYNIIKVNGRDFLSTGVDSTEEQQNDLRYYEGLLTDVIDLSKSYNNHKVTLNGTVVLDSGEMPSKSTPYFFGNTFEINIGMNDFNDEGIMLKSNASISFSVQLDITTANKDHKAGSISFNPYVTNNTFIFEDLHHHNIITKATLNYPAEELQANAITMNNHMSNNTFTINKREEEGFNYGETIFSYVNPNAQEFSPWEGQWEIGLEASTRDNYICDELLRRFNGVFEYIPERMEDPDKPLLNKATITHVLNMEIDTKPSIDPKTNTLQDKLVAKETPLSEVALRNIVIINQGEDISNIPDGTLVFVKAGE